MLEVIRDLNVVPIELLKLLCAILNINYIQVNDGLLLSDPIIQSNGVLQGDPLSALLFNLLTHDIPRRISEATNGAAKVVMYADDLAIITDDVETLQTALDTLFLWCEERRMQVNKDKTKVIKFRNSGNTKKHVVMYDNKQLEFVNDVEYLGFTLQCTTRSFSMHVSKRCTNAVNAMFTISNIPLLSLKTAIKLFDLKVAPVASYGIQIIWPKLKLSDLQKLESVKSTYLKRAMSLSKFTRNRLVYLLANCKSFFVSELKDKFKLPDTPAYLEFIRIKNENLCDINPEFLKTRAMTTSDWTKPHQRDRHVFTRFAVHGFHHLICKNTSYHESSDNCVCKLCNEKQCGTYHLLKCTKKEKSLIDYASGK
jgi:hypothetical protein